MNDRVLMVASGSWKSGLAFSYMRALTALGMRVTQFDLEAERRKVVGPLGKLGARLMSHLDFFSLNAQANRALFVRAAELQPALIIVVGVEHVRPATLIQLKISVPGVRLVNLFPDMLFNIRDGMMTSLPLYDIFSFHTRAGVPILKDIGCRGAYYLPFGADPTLHHPEELAVEDRRTFGCEVVYVGNYRSEHEALFRSLEGLDLKIWGSERWRLASGWVRSRWQGRPLLTGTEYSKAHCAAKVCLDPIDPLDLPGHNMRVFELPACGVFSLVTRTEEVQELFREGETVECFGSPEELLEKTRYFLAHPEARAKIAAAARKHVLENGHTYQDRAATLLREVGITPPGR